MGRDQMTRSEHGEQQALFEWAQIQVNLGTHPELVLMYAIPNWRAKESERIYLAAEGAKKGVPDICLPAARGGFHGLYIEMKTERGRATKEQRSWLEALAGMGYYAVICRGFESARDVIVNYLTEVN